MVAPVRPRCFLDLQHGTEPVGRVVIELFTDKTPRTCENFRSLCTALTSPSLHYKSSIFHRVIEEFMLQGGDITRGDGKGGVSIYGDTFEDENLGWCDIDKEGLVCMANRGKDTNSSQFFITCAPCDHLNGKHTVFGHVVSGLQFVKEMEKVRVDSSDKPVVDVIISNCGELEFRRAPGKATATRTTDTKPSRDGKRPRSQSRSRSRSRSRSESRSGSRTRDRHRSRTRSPRAKSDRHKRQDRDKDSRRSGRRHRDRADRSRSPRRHGDASTKESVVSPSQNQDIRFTSRSESPEKLISATGQRDSRSSRNHHKSSRQPYSHSRSRSRDHRGRGRDYGEDDFDSEEERRIQREEDERESNRRQPQYQRPYRSPSRRDDRYSVDSGQSEVKFKGRGSMKYREKGGYGGYNRFGRLI